MMNPFEEGKKKFPVPDGFQTLLESFAREALRFQPQDIFTFSSAFFDVLLRVRSDNHITGATLTDPVYDEFKQALIQECQKRNVKLACSFPYAVSPVLITPYEHKDENANLTSASGYSQGDSISDELAATKIQAVYKGYKVRKALDNNGVTEDTTNLGPDNLETGHQQKLGHIEEQEGHEEELGHPMEPSPETSPRTSLAGSGTGNGTGSQAPYDVEAAVAKIQAGVRGYLTRKELKKQKVAATKIQAGIRGHLTRKHLKKAEREKEESAATKIQSRFRGHKTRMTLREQSPAGNLPAAE